MSYEFTPEAAERARKAFRDVLETAVPGYELGQLLLFADEDEKYIRDEVQRKLYEPKLPNGGDRERKFVDRLIKLSREEWPGGSRAGWAASQWKLVLAENPRHPGRYYIRHPLTPKGQAREFKFYTDLKHEASAEKQWDKKWFADLMLGGLPEPVSNYAMECLFLLKSSDGEVDRLVRLKNVLGEMSRGPNIGGSEILDSDAFHAPQKFRKWCLGRGNFNWAGNEKQVELLHEDIANEAAWKTINRIDSVGWHPLNGKKAVTLSRDKTVLVQRGIYFFDECAYVDGKRLMPDADGIIWHEGEGYFLMDRGRESVFVQGRPKMQPELSLAVVAEKITTEGWENVPAIADDFMMCFWRELCTKCYETLGSHEGWLALGSVLAYAVGPEIFAQYRFCAGLWVHGQRGSGKTSFVSWLMSLWGFAVTSGIGIAQKTSSAVGMLQQAENYSYIVLWLDEFRDNQVGEDKAGILRNAYDRAMQAKWSPDGISRVLKTGFVVSGESTSSDGATRNRYAHVQVSAANRLKDHEAWFIANSPYFFLFARLIMERRAEYVYHFQQQFQLWLQRPELAGIDDREKKVHGVAYSGWVAMTALLGSHGADEITSFRTFMLSHVKRSAADVANETNINIFFVDLITAFRAEAIPPICFRVTGEIGNNPPGAPNQGGRWKSYKLLIEPNSTLSALQIYLTKGRGQITLKRNDLRDQLSKEPYWVAGDHRYRFGPKGDRSNSPCWIIDMDKHPMGYQPVPMDVFEKFLLDQNEGEADPRMGPLYHIVQQVEAIVEK